MATATSSWGLPTWKLIINFGSQLHGADGPFLWGPDSGMIDYRVINRDCANPVTSRCQQHDHCQDHERLVSRLRAEPQS